MLKISSIMAVLAFSALCLSNCVNETLLCYQTGQTVDATIFHEAINRVCARHEDHRIINAEDPSVPTIFTYSNEDHIDIVLTIEIVDSLPPHCSYILRNMDCTNQFRKPVSLCNADQGGTVTDNVCGLRWTIASGNESSRYVPDGIARNISSCNDVQLVEQMHPQHSHVNRATNATLVRPKPHQNYEDASGWTAQGCYNSGRQWTTEDLLAGANRFCTWAQEKTVEPGDFLNYTFHYCVEGIDHKQWFTIQTQTGAPAQQIQFAQCMDGLFPFIENCNTGDDDDAVKQGGWGMNSGGYMIIDGDPDEHNAGKAQPAIACENVKAVAAHRAMVEEGAGSDGNTGSSIALK